MEQTIWQEYRDEDVVVWGINFVEDPDLVAAWIDLVHPNPVRRGAAISFDLRSPGTAIVDILDVSGRRVRRLLRSPADAGSHVVIWDGRDGSGRLKPGGIYLAESRPWEAPPRRRFW